MECKFVVGQKVVCVGSIPELEAGKVYTVSFVGMGFLNGGGA